MRRIQIPGLANPVVQFVLGLAILGAVTGGFFHFAFHLTTVALTYLVVIMAIAIFGGVIPAFALVAVATGLLAYYFAPPIFSFAVASPEEAVALVAFVLA